VDIDLGAGIQADKLDWTIRELAMYDLPALVEHVCRETGYDKVCPSAVSITV
jgi:hypothetical protein